MLSRISLVLFSVAALAFDATPAPSSFSSSLTVVVATPHHHRSLHQRHQDRTSESVSNRLAELSDQIERIEEWFDQEQLDQQMDPEDPENLYDENDWFADSDAADAPRPVSTKQPTHRR